VESDRKPSVWELDLFSANLEVGGTEGRDEFARELGRQWVFNQGDQRRMQNVTTWLAHVQRIDRFVSGRPTYTMGQQSAQGMAEARETHLSNS